MFSRLSIRHKMLIQPALAVVGFCVVLFVTFVLSSQTSSQLRRVQTGYYPSVELSQELNEDLGAIQRALQDAVAAKNLDGLPDADGLHDTFVQSLGVAQSNPVLNSRELEQLKTDIDDYYKIARQTSQQMITSVGNEDLSAALTAMREKYISIRDKLQANKTRDKAAIEKAFDDTRGSQNYALVFVSLTTLVCLVPMIALSWRLTGAVTQPLLEAVRVADAMAHGNLALSITAAPSDETGRMLRALRQMIENLNLLLRQVKRSSSQLDSAASLISTTAKVQEASVADVKVVTHEIASAVNQISATRQELERALNHVSTRVAETAALADVGQASLKNMDSSMNQLAQANEVISGRLAIITEKAETMSGIIAQLTNVTDQANLLSLNAEIEAAKAGQFGLGFTIVAREIRRLADQSAVGTLHIEQMVQEMQVAVTEGARGIAELSGQMSRGVTAVATTSEQLRLIIDRVQHLTPQFEAVREGMQSQSAGTRQIQEAMTQLTSVTDSTSSSAHELMQATHNLHDAVAALREEMSHFNTGDASGTATDADSDGGQTPPPPL